MSLELSSNEILLQQLVWRYAVKKFDPTRKINQADWQALEQTLILAPTSYGLQPYKFFVITDQKTKEELMPHAWNQTQVRDCSHLVVIAGKKDLTETDVNRYFERIKEIRQTPEENLTDYRATLGTFTQQIKNSGELKNWTARQCYIVLGFLLFAAAMRGIDTCPMEGFVPEGVDEVLKLAQQNLTAVILCPIGYRASDDWLGQLAKVRLTRDELVQEI